MKFHIVCVGVIHVEISFVHLPKERIIHSLWSSLTLLHHDLSTSSSFGSGSSTILAATFNLSGPFNLWLSLVNEFKAAISQFDTDILQHYSIYYELVSYCHDSPLIDYIIHPPFPLNQV